MFTALVAGGAGGLLCAGALALRRPEQRGIPLAVFLGVAAGIYVGFGLVDGRATHALVQAAGALPFVAVAAWFPRALLPLGIAWIAHGAWDGAHEVGWITTRVPGWYPGACLGWDLVLGASALAWVFFGRPGEKERKAP